MSVSGTSRLVVATTLAAAVLSFATARVSAQSLSGDAREVGLAGYAHAARTFDENAATQSVQFVVPLGLLQMLGDRDALRPGSATFDPAIALEYAAVPAHYVIGRQSSTARARFISDIRQAGLNPDLSSYRGFTPAATLEGAGLLAPTWGRAFTVHGTADTFSHGLYVGAGPYLSLRSAALFDQRLVNMLGASSATYVPSSSLEIGSQSSGQVAAQITGGYRGRAPIRTAGADGRLEFEANYNHLQGFRYEDVDLNLRLDTDGQGLLAVRPGRGAPLAIDRRFSTGGTGFAVDLATTAIFQRWRVSVGADGIGNRINWRNVVHREYELSQLTGGSNRVTAVSSEAGPDIREQLPVATRIQGAYLADRWGGVAELQRGFQGTTASAALERRFSKIELRAGARLVNRVVLPAAGTSLKAGPVWFDIGAAVSTANIERQRNIVLASSIRLVLNAPARAPAGVAAVQ